MDRLTSLLKAVIVASAASLIAQIPASVASACPPLVAWVVEGPGGPYGYVVYEYYSLVPASSPPSEGRRTIVLMGPLQFELPRLSGAAISVAIISSVAVVCRVLWSARLKRPNQAMEQARDSVQ